MMAFEFDGLARERARSGQRYHEFLRVPSMSAGLYHLKAGEPDPQGPHNEDELYFVVRGRGMIAVGGVDRDVASGSIVFVPALVEHRFHAITEDLDVLVFFAPAET